MEQFDRQEGPLARNATQPLFESSSNGKGQDTPNFPKTPLTHNPNKCWIERVSLIDPSNSIDETEGASEKKNRILLFPRMQKPFLLAGWMQSR
jgi:hypothetical protein